MLPLAVSVGDVLAAYAAVVSTIVAATQLIRGRAGVKVLLAPVVAEVESHEYIELWEIRVVNHKPRPITIRGAGLLHEGAQLIDRGPTPLHSSFCDPYARPIESPFPKMLNDGASVEVFVQYGMEPAPKGAWARDEL